MSYAAHTSIFALNPEDTAAKKNDIRVKKYISRNKCRNRKSIMMKERRKGYSSNSKERKTVDAVCGVTR